MTSYDSAVEQKKSLLENDIKELSANFEKSLNALKERLRLDQQICKHPWTSLGIAFVIGASLGLRKGFFQPWMFGLLVELTKNRSK